MHELASFLPTTSLALGIILLVWIIVLHIRITKLTRGSQGSSLEHLISENNQSILKLQESHATHHQDISKLKDDVMRTLQRVGVVRFNPFKDMGGNQSFAIAIVDKNNDGLVLSSLYTRERVNVFAKPVQQGNSSFPLTQEELEAIKQAQA